MSTRRAMPRLATRRSETRLNQICRVGCGSGCSQLERVTLLLIIELLHELKEQVLQFCQTLAATIFQVLKIIFERLEPFVHSCAVVDERGVSQARQLVICGYDHAFAETSLFNPPYHELRAVFVREERFLDVSEKCCDFTSLGISGETQILDLPPNDFSPSEELCNNIQS